MLPLSTHLFSHWLIPLRSQESIPGLLLKSLKIRSLAIITKYIWFAMTSFIEVRYKMLLHINFVKTNDDIYITFVINFSERRC
jgi:hypothetical protein